MGSLIPSEIWDWSKYRPLVVKMALILIAGLVGLAALVLMF